MRPKSNKSSDNSSSRYQELRWRLLRRGFSLRGWALKQGYPVTTVYSAARGERIGVRSMRIARELEAFIEQ